METFGYHILVWCLTWVIVSSGLKGLAQCKPGMPLMNKSKAQVQKKRILTPLPAMSCVPRLIIAHEPGTSCLSNTLCVCETSVSALGWMHLSTWYSELSYQKQSCTDKQKEDWWQHFEFTTGSELLSLQ